MLKEVYTDEDKELISITRRLTDWPSLAIRLHRLGPVITGTLEQSQYLLDCRKAMRSLRDIPDSIILDQFNKFIFSLHDETKNMQIDQIKKTDSKDLIRRFLNTDLNIFKGIEMVMAATIVGCIRFGLSSVAESIISKYNIHSSDI